MKLFSVREAKSHFSACLEESQKKGASALAKNDPLVLTKSGPHRESRFAFATRRIGAFSP